ncbi:GNAT family N-acetyltransferase [Eupransor demetentiae]|uniref:L-amino acid N-acyltransferase MnaT (MnaT) n=1 Tax=Eupransor demetentiae TaxID=3109584 RepID=A0ABM9N5R3_9LACO|nr:L-amino acid N-acyltransferase MnaT (MnaT) [Lactobacillaceae bacterium LMG 33000]
MTIVIRPAVQADLARMTAIYNQAIEQGYITADLDLQTPEEKQDWFDFHHDNKRFPLFGVYQDDKLLGYGYLGPFNDRKGYEMTAEVTYYLDFEARGHGLGTKILKYLMDYAKSVDIKVLVALVYAGNDASIGLLKKFGFETWGELPEIGQAKDGRLMSLDYLGKHLL